MSVVVIAGTEKGAWIFRSRDRVSWQVEGPLFKGWKVTCSGRAPRGRYLVGTTSRVYGTALHASDDLERWRQIERGPAYPAGTGRQLNQIWTLAAGAERMWAGVDEAGLFCSEDEGESWRPVPGLNDHPTRERWFPGAGGLCAHVVLAHPKEPRRLWCGISAVGCWRSDDGGQSWHLKNEGVKKLIEDQEHAGIGYCIHGLALDPDDPDVIYRQDHAGMYKSTDGGDHWEEKAHGLVSSFGFPIALDPRSKSLFAFPLESDEYRLPVQGRFEIYRSTDGAESWHPLREGLPVGPTYAAVLRSAMAVDGLTPGGVYAGATSGSLFASADAGATWRELPGRLPRVLSVEAYWE